MNKKQAIKVLSATAIAASAFVATAPAMAASNTNSDAASQVQKAKDAATVLKWAISTEGSADGTTRPWAQYNAAKAARDAAVAAVNKLPAAQKTVLLADIDKNVNLHINRTMYYIDAITAGEKISVKKAALQKQIDENKIDDATEAAYHELSTEIRKQAILLDKVYGQSTRDEIRAQYKKSAETVRDSVKYEVSAKIELDLAKKALADNNSADVEKHLAKAAEYMKDVKNDVMKVALTKVQAEVEAQMTPQVNSVSLMSATQVEVKFSVPVSKDSLFTNGKSGAFKATVSLTTLAGDNVPSGSLTGELSADGKTLVITSQNALSKRYDVVIEGLKATNNKDVVKYQKVVTFAADTQAPSIIGTEQISATQVKINFSEPVKAYSSATIKYADGSTVSNVTVNVAEGAKEV